MTTRKILAVTLTAALILTATSGCGKKEEPELAAEAVNVSLMTVGTGDLANTVSYTGELKTSDSTSNIAKVSARVEKVYVEEGDYVHAGDILAELDATSVRNAYESAKANYNSAQANYDSVINSATRQSAATAQNNLKTAQLAYDQAQENYNREKQLYDSGSAITLAQQRYDDALGAYNREKELYDNDTALVSARNSLKTAEDNLANMQELYSIGAVSKLEFDNAVTNVDNLRASLSTLESQRQASYDNAYSALTQAEENLNTTKITARASLDNAENTLNNAANSLSVARENINLTGVANESSKKTAKASLETAKTNLETAETNLADTKIRALSSGYIASKNATVGQMAAAGTELFSIKNTSSLMAEISVTESIIPQITESTKAIIAVDSAKISGIDGYVSLVNPTKNEKTGMYTVQVNIDNPDGKLNVGMFATVTLSIDSTENAIVIPNDALLVDGEDYYVYVVSSDETKAERRNITVGIENDDNTEVITGLSAGDQLIISGQDYLSDDNLDIKIVED